MVTEESARAGMLPGMFRVGAVAALAMLCRNIGSPINNTAMPVIAMMSKSAVVGRLARCGEYISPHLHRQ